MRRHFGAFGAVAEVKLYRKGSYGFVRYKAHADAVRAIVGMNGQVRCSAVLAACCLLLLLLPLLLVACVGSWIVRLCGSTAVSISENFK